MRTLGYEEGKNLVIEKRFSEGKQERLSEYAEDLVRRNVELIVALGTHQSIAAARSATQTVPIVMHSALAPIEDGFIASLARPGGNITGTAWAPQEAIHLGTTSVTWRDPSAVFAPYGSAELNAMAKELDPVFEKIVRDATTH